MNANELKDSRSLRIVDVIDNDLDKNLTGMSLHIKVSGTLPIITTESKVINNVTKESIPATIDTPETVINFIADIKYKQEKGEERFIFMSRLSSTLTGDEIFIVYDKKYSDILIIPTLSTLNVVNDIIASGSKRTFSINGYRLGSGCDLVSKNPGAILSTDENIVAKIKTAKSYNKTMKSTSVIISNLTPLNNAQGTTHSKIDGQQIITYNNQQLATCINLGKITDLLEDVSVGIPLYLLYRYSPASYGISYIDHLKSGDYDLLVFLPF